MNEEYTKLEANDSTDEGNTETEETATSPELEGEQDEERITLTKSELEERERAIRKEQDKRWKDRLKGQKGDETTQEGTSVVATKEELDRFRLEQKGVEDKATQDFVLKYASLEGMSVQEALKDEIVQAKLSKMNADAERVRATGSPFNRTARPREKTPEELARMAEKGQIPTSKEDRKAALQALQSKYGRT